MDDNVQKTAYQEGKRAGLAIAAVAVGAVAFIGLLGFEKALLALVLALLACRGAAPKSEPRRRAAIAISLTILYGIAFAVVIIVFHEKLGGLMHMFQKMS